MKKLNLTGAELINISCFIEDIAERGTEGTTGGMYSGNVYITPSTCYNVAIAIKKINEFFYDNPTLYKEAYDKLMKFAKNK